MGFEIKFNWVLQIEPADDLIPGEVYYFKKSGSRAFPIETSIDLINLSREAIAKIHILEFNNTNKETKGKYRILKIYEGEEKKVLTNYWIENQ